MQFIFGGTKNYSIHIHIGTKRGHRYFVLRNDFVCCRHQIMAGDDTWSTRSICVCDFSGAFRLVCQPRAFFRQTQRQRRQRRDTKKRHKINFDRVFGNENGIFSCICMLEAQHGEQKKNELIRVLFLFDVSGLVSVSMGIAPDASGPNAYEYKIYTRHDTTHNCVHVIRLKY